MRTARHERGAAVVETALGVMVMVTVLLFGVHFGEILWVAMKVQEAGAGAKWDASAMRVHYLPGDYTPASGVAERVARTATDRYQDFDGRRSVRKKSALTLVTAAASNMEVKCQLATDVTFPRGPMPRRLSGVYQDVGGIRCQATADTWLTRIPHAFAEGGNGLFAARHVDGADRYHACSFGRPFANDCADGPTVLLGDWGLAGTDEAYECYLASGDKCPNQAYFNSAKSVYDSGGKAKGYAAMQFARSIVGTVPIDPNQFFFSFRGEESEFTECTPLTDGEGPNKWVTNPGLGSPIAEYNDGYLARGNCALGWPVDPLTGQCPAKAW